MKTITFLTLLLMSSPAVKGQITLQIEINELNNSTGHIALELRDGEEHPLKEITQQIINNKSTITIDSLKAGKYAFKYFHDKNDNKKLDTYWVGAPKEGYGFSNNAKGKFGPPPFKNTIFELKTDTIVYCIPTYIEF